MNPAPNSHLPCFISQALELRSLHHYALHPVEAVVQYHRVHAEKSSEEGHGGLDFEQAKLTTEQALKGYDYLKSHSSRSKSGS